MTYASKESVKNLIYISLQCAVFYVEYEKEVFEINGRKLTGANLKAFVERQNKYNRIPAEITKWMYKSWINPKLNLYLQEGDFRYKNKLPSSMYYFEHQKMTQKECTYLIQRFSKMHNEITERYSASQ